MRGMTCVSGHCSNVQIQHICRWPAERRIQAHLSSPPLFPVRVAGVTGKIKRKGGGGMAMQTALCCQASLREIKAAYMSVRLWLG